MARPRKDESEKMTAFLRVPVTPAQKAVIDEAAKANPSGTAAWARLVLLEAAAKRLTARKTPE